MYVREQYVYKYVMLCSILTGANTNKSCITVIQNSQYESYTYPFSNIQNNAIQL